MIDRLLRIAELLLWRADGIYAPTPRRALKERQTQTLLTKNRRQITLPTFFDGRGGAIFTSQELNITEGFTVQNAWATIRINDPAPATDGFFMQAALQGNYGLATWQDMAVGPVLFGGPQGTYRGSGTYGLGQMMPVGLSLATKIRVVIRARTDLNNPRRIRIPQVAVFLAAGKVV